MKRSNSIQIFERDESGLDEVFFREIKQLNHNKKKHGKNDGDSTSLELPPPCTCPYFGDKSCVSVKQTDVKIHSVNSNFLTPDNNQSVDNFNTSSISNNSISDNPSTNSLSITQSTSPVRKYSYPKCNSVVTWDSRRYQRRGSSVGGNAKTSLLQTPNKSSMVNSSPLRRSVTLRHHNNTINSNEIKNINSPKITSSPCILQRNATIRSHHSRNSSVISRNSSRHGRIIRLEQKATKVLGVCTTIPIYFVLRHMKYFIFSLKFRWFFLHS